MLRIPRRLHPPQPARFVSTQTNRGDARRPLDSRRTSIPSSSQSESKGVFLRPWDGVGSMAELFAILRGVERKFGKIKEFRISTDYEVQQQYQSFIIVSFRDPASYDLVPSDSAVIQIPVPKRSGYRNGGIGLDDLDGLLEPCERVPEEGNGEEMEAWGGVVQRLVEKEEARGKEEATADGMTVIDVKVERTIKPFFSPWPHYVSDFASREQKLAFGHAWMDWGGFAGVRPLEQSPFASASSSSPAKETALNTITSPHLRSALSKWAQFTNRPDPSISVPIDVVSSPPPPATTPPSPEFLHDDSPIPEPPKEWDPLPPSAPTPTPITNTAPPDTEPTPDATPPPSATPPKVSRPSRKQRKLLSAKETGTSSDANDARLKRDRKWADDGEEKQEEVSGIAGRVKKLFGGWL